MPAATDEARVLRSCLWELTLRCNLRCMHCGSVAGASRAGELSLGECLRVADEVLALGCEDMTFIGGEVFLFDGWERLARHCADYGVAVNIMTNGYRFGSHEIGAIQQAGLRNVGISLDGMETNHNRIRGRPDAFAHILRAFDLLNAAEIPIGVVTSLFEWNAGDLEPMYELLLAHDVTLWQLQLVNPMGNMAGRRDLILDPARIPALTAFVRDKCLQRRMAVLAADNIGYFDENESYIRGARWPLVCWDGCQAGLTSVFIDSAGNVKGCGALYDDRFVEGNVRRHTLREIWFGSATFRYNRAFDVSLLGGRCRDCAIGDTCRGGCRASNYFCTGSLYQNAFCHGFHPTT